LTATQAVPQVGDRRSGGRVINAAGKDWDFLAGGATLVPLNPTAGDPRARSVPADCRGDDRNRTGGARFST